MYNILIKTFSSAEVSEPNHFMLRLELKVEDKF